MTQRVFRVSMSERCFPFETDSLLAHAPRRGGVYEIIGYGKSPDPEVLYVGLACPGTIFDRLAAHLMGKIRPTGEDLSRAGREVFFDFVAGPQDAGPEDWKDIAGALMIRHNPRFNLLDNPPSSGRYASVRVEES
jgi:hypothetical protein